MNKIEFGNMQDMVDITIRELHNIVVIPQPEKKLITVNCFLFGESKIIELPFAELKLYRGSAKSFINYLNEKMTEGLGLKEKTDGQI